MEAGQKYLNVKIAGLPEFFVAFPNQDKEGNQPDYKGDGIAVWVKEKKAKETPKI